MFISREYQHTSGAFAFRIEISEPERAAQDGACSIVLRLTEANGMVTTNVFEGIDAMQAIQIAFDAARVHVAGRNALWHGHAAELSSPRSISASYGPDVYARLVQAHDAELLAVFAERAATRDELP